MHSLLNKSIYIYKINLIFKKLFRELIKSSPGYDEDSISISNFFFIFILSYCRFIDDKKGFVLGNDGVLLRYLG